MLTIGQILHNRYEVSAVLGRGGGVYRAYDQRLGIESVVKELRLQPVTDRPLDTAILFWQEANKLSRLTHPDLPRVTDYFQEGGAYYLVMDLVTGQNLQALIGAGLPEDTVLRYANQLLDVLAYIHSQGVVHGDIKPANVIIDPSGHAMLVDFALPHVVSATSAYTPPEHYPIGAHPRGDIYALAATLYHALTGQAPSSAARRLAGAPLAPARLNRVITPVTERAILKALSLDPNLCFQSASEFRAALNGDETTMAMAVPPDEEVPENVTPVMPRQAAVMWRLTFPRSLRFLAVILGLLLCAAVVLALMSILPSPASRVLHNPTPRITFTQTMPIVVAPDTAAALLAASATAPASTELPPTDTPVPAPTCQQGQAVITSPTQGAVLHGTVPIMGTASCDGFAYYKFEFVDARCGALGLCFVAGEFTQPVLNGLLMNWDTTHTWDGQPLPNGTYILRLTVVGQGDSPLPQKPEVTITIDNH